MKLVVSHRRVKGASVTKIINQLTAHLPPEKRFGARKRMREAVVYFRAEASEERQRKK